MARRIFIGNDTDGTFKMRVSRPGFDARSAAIENLLIHENMVPEISMVTGVVALPAGQRSSIANVNPTSIVVNLGRTYDFMPKIVLMCDQGFLPTAYTFYCSLSADTGDLTVYNRITLPLQIRYAVYQAQNPNASA